ncbi:MAG: hypothetical protein IT548_02260 [Alphaproteobacteria bacterium]|nr:hypothetical protein [Alphaproteobacteria bacterium]
MSKYGSLTTFLNAQAGSSLPMTFRDVEKVIGASLPPSAFRHRPWWSNNPGNNVMTKAWLEAGWVTSDVDVPGQKLVFRRNQREERNAPKLPSTDYPVPSHEVTLKGLSEDAMRWLALRADAAQKTVPEIAAQVVENHVKPSVAERLEMLDRLRAQTTLVGDVDIVAMIRADRDSR